MGIDGHPVVAAVYDPIDRAVCRLLLGRHREYLVDGIRGPVLDLGTGTGGLYPHLADRDVEGGGDRPDPSADLDVHAVDPDPHMLSQARGRAAESGVDVTLLRGDAEALPYADDSFEYVLASVVFCTIPDPERALAEVARVLRPGGELRFVEHVRADGWRARLQSAIDPLWTRLAGGCHLDRDTGVLFASHPAFDVVELSRLPIGVTPVRPFVRGRLRRRARPRSPSK